MANAGKTPPTGPLTARERRLALLVSAAVGAAAVAAAAFAVIERPAGSGQSGEPCITVSIASSMGGGVEHACGAAARAACSAVGQQQDAHAVAVRDACRSARIEP